MIFIIHIAGSLQNPSASKPGPAKNKPPPMIDQIAEESFQGMGQIDAPLAQDRAEFEIRPRKPTKKIHIFLDGPGPKKLKKPKKALKLSSDVHHVTTHVYDDEELTTEQPYSKPEVTTRADNHRYEDPPQSTYNYNDMSKKKHKKRLE